MNSRTWDVEKWRPGGTGEAACVGSPSASGCFIGIAGLRFGPRLPPSIPHIAHRLRAGAGVDKLSAFGSTKNNVESHELARRANRVLRWMGCKRLSNQHLCGLEGPHSGMPRRASPNSGPDGKPSNRSFESYLGSQPSFALLLISCSASSTCRFERACDLSRRHRRGTGCGLRNDKLSGRCRCSWDP